MKPAGVEVLRKGDYFIADIPQADALALVREHHYAGGGSKTAVYRHGLFHVDSPDECLGVAWWLPPTKVAAQSVHPDWRRVLSLTRLVVVPGVPQNAATFLLAKSVRVIRGDGRWAALVTWADEGQGHTGAIYLGANWTPLGARAGGTAVWKDAAGRQVSAKAGPRTRTKAEMESLGYVNTGRTLKRKFVLILEPAVQEAAAA